MNNTTKKTKITQGRQKIEIKKIENTSNRQVTFSKRRTGLFKKAAELCILSGAEVAIIVKSPGKRTFAFGHPSVDAVIGRYLVANNHAAGPADAVVNALMLPAAAGGGGGGRRPSEEEFNRHYELVSKELEEEKLRSNAIEESKKKAGNGGGYWWNEPVDNLGLSELEQFAAALDELKKKVSIRASELMLEREASKPIMPMPLTIFGSDHGSIDRLNFVNQVSDCGTSLPPPPPGFEFRDRLF